MIWFGEFKFSHDWPGLVKNSWRCCYELNLEFMSETAHPTQISYWIPLVSYWVNIWISFSEHGLRFCMMFDYGIPRACHAEEFAKCPGMAIPGFEEWTIYVNYAMYNEYVWLYVPQGQLNLRFCLHVLSTRTRMGEFCLQHVRKKCYTYWQW